MTEMAILLRHLPVHELQGLSGCLQGAGITCRRPIGTNENEVLRFASEPGRPERQYAPDSDVPGARRGSRVRSPSTGSFNRRSCQHCDRGSLCHGVPWLVPSRRTRTLAFVHVDDSKCVGCQYCEGVCPFDVPRYRTDGSIRDIRQQVHRLRRIAWRRAWIRPAFPLASPMHFASAPRDEMLEACQERLEDLEGPRLRTDAEHLRRQRDGRSARDFTC